MAAAESDPPLLLAVRAGNLEQVQKLLSSGANPNQKTGTAGNCPLIAASIRGNVAVVQALVNKGANINIQNTVCFALILCAFSSALIRVPHFTCVFVDAER